MVIQHIRWQAVIALSGILLLLTMLGYLSNTIETALLPEPGGSYIEGISSRPGNLNPLYLQTRADYDLADLLFLRLTRANESGLIGEELATSWDISDNRARYTFHLREDVLWHDGAPFTAEDVAFTIRVIQDPAYVGDPAAVDLWRNVEVEVVDPYTVRFTLPTSLVPFAPFLSFTTLPILPAHLLAEVPVAELPDHSFSRFPIGTGPWRIERVEGEEIVLEPHPEHFGETTMLDHLIFRFYDDPAATLQAYRRGEIMGISQVRPEDVTPVLGDSSLNLYTTQFSGYTAIFFNLKRPMLQDRTLRQALLLGLDRQLLIDEVLARQGIVADSFLMPTHWAFDAQLPRYAYEPGEAAEMLERVGWTDSDGDGIRDKEGQPLTFTLISDESNPRLGALNEAIARQWAELGVQVEARPVTPDGLRERLRQREFDLVMLTTPVSGLPADPDFYPLWHSSQVGEEGQNLTSFASEEADRLLVEARRNTDPVVRRELYRQFQTLLAEQVPAFPIYYPIYNYAISTLVKEVQLAPMTNSADRFRSLPEWYIKSRRVFVESGQPTPTLEP